MDDDDGRGALEERVERMEEMLAEIISLLISTGEWPAPSPSDLLDG